MKTKTEILNELFDSPFLNKYLNRIDRKNLKEDLKQEIFLILFKMDDSKIIEAYYNNYLNYLALKTMNNQYYSRTSPFYTKYILKNKYIINKEYDDDILIDENDIDININDIKEYAFNNLIEIIDTKLNFVDGELFKMRYKLGDYNLEYGKLADKKDRKKVYSYRKMENKLTIIDINGQKIRLCHNRIRSSIIKSIEIIRKELNKKINKEYDDDFNF